jgi:hypothetical protein
MRIQPVMTGEELRHTLNNLFTKIMGAADLALVTPRGPDIRSELEVIIGLAEEGSKLISSFDTESPER